MKIRNSGFDLFIYAVSAVLTLGLVIVVRVVLSMAFRAAFENDE